MLRQVLALRGALEAAASRAAATTTATQAATATTTATQRLFSTPPPPPAGAAPPPPPPGPPPPPPPPPPGTNVPQDYGLVLSAAREVAAAHCPTPPPPGEVGMAAGVPLETFRRRVRVFSPARTAGQQGLGGTALAYGGSPGWKIEFDVRSKWTNPLMGWTSTADPLENVAAIGAMTFYSKEEAVAFCERQGWKVAEADDPNLPRPDRQRRFAGYGDNFSTRRKGVPDLSHLRSVTGKGGYGPDVEQGGGGKKK